MTEHRVSAVITAYNSEAFVAEAIASALQQTLAPDEILIVDDGSTDHTRDVVAGFDDERIRYLRQENSGAGAARNLGIREATGQFIAFLDADDIWFPDKTRLQADYLATHPEIALVSGLAVVWDIAKGTRRQRGDVALPMKMLRRELLVRNVIGNPSMCMVRRTALLEVGLFDPNVRLCADYDLWSRMAARFELAMLPTPLTVYRWHAGNLSNQYRWARFSSTWEISRRAIARSRPAWLRPWFLARAWSTLNHRKAVYAIQWGFPRWRQVLYEVAASVTYPWDDTSEKLRTLVRAVMGDTRYQSIKRFLRTRILT